MLAKISFNLSFCEILADRPGKPFKLYKFMKWYARHGHELMGCKSPMCESCYDQWVMAQTLADGKGVSARKGLKEALIKRLVRTRTQGVVGAGGLKSPASRFR